MRVAAASALTTPAPVTTAQVPRAAVTAAAAERADPTIEMELVAPSAQELGDVMSLAARAGIKLQPKVVKPSVRDELATLDQPVVEHSVRLSERRDKLLDALRTGTGDPQKLVRELDGLSVLIEVARRQEEKRLLMKQLLKQLIMGAITPQTIRLAKQLGLTDFLKDAIKEMVKRGFLSPEAVKSIAGMLQDAGIPMPQLDELLVAYQRKVDGQVNAARDARGQELVSGTAGPSSAVIGATTLFGDTTGLS